MPQKIKDYVSLHFPNCTITKVEIEDDQDDDEMYEVKLSCDCELEFDKFENIIEIECKSKLPDSTIPTKILSYVNSNFPNNYIVSWEIKGKIQKVELSDKNKLVFDLEDNFLY